MPQFFKGIEEKKPFTYPAIVEVRKGSVNYKVWIIGVVALLIVLGIILLIFRYPIQT